MNLETALKQDVVRHAQHLLQNPFDHGTVEWKGPRNPVTNYDKAIEQSIRHTAAQYGATVLGEEYAPQRGSGGDIIIVDPIDGTKSFIRGQHGCAISVAIADAHTKQIHTGIVADVRTGLLYYADPHESYTEHLWSGGRWQLRHENHLDELDLVTNYREDLSMPLLLEAGYVVRKSTAIALQLAQVAAGQIDAAIYRPGKGATHDLAAGFALIDVIARRGDLHYTDIEGNAYDPWNPGNGFLVASPSVHAHLLEILREAIPAGTPPAIPYRGTGLPIG
jgi:myo-inositol-1(or 4)-monophosphatase